MAEIQSICRVRVGVADLYSKRRSRATTCGFATIEDTPGVRKSSYRCLSYIKMMFVVFYELVVEFSIDLNESIVG